MNASIFYSRKFAFIRGEKADPCLVAAVGFRVSAFGLKLFCLQSFAFFWLTVLSFMPLVFWQRDDEFGKFPFFCFNFDITAVPFHHHLITER